MCGEWCVRRLHSSVLRAAVWYGMVWCGMVWYGMVWCGGVVLCYVSFLNLCCLGNELMSFMRPASAASRLSAWSLSAIPRMKPDREMGV